MYLDKIHLYVVVKFVTHSAADRKFFYIIALLTEKNFHRRKTFNPTITSMNTHHQSNEFLSPMMQNVAEVNLYTQG